MVLTKNEIKDIMEVVNVLRDEDVVNVNRSALAEQHTRDEKELAGLSNKLVTIGKGFILKALIHCSEHGLSIKQPSFRVYISIDEVSDIPYIRASLSSTPLASFSFKETIDTRMDSTFAEKYIGFLEKTIYSFIAHAVAHENVNALNELLQQVKSEIEAEDLKVAFDLSFAIHDKPIAYIANDKLVLGTTYEKMFNLVSANSQLDSLFNAKEVTAYIAEAIKSSIKEDWTTSPNPLVFVRKHNQYLIGLVTGDLNTRRTQRVDVLIRNSFSLAESSLKFRKKAIAHKLEKNGDETYISVWEKEGKDSEPVEILSPVNVKSLTYVG